MKKTDRREAVKVIGGAIVVGAGLTVPGLALARARGLRYHEPMGAPSLPDRAALATRAAEAGSAVSDAPHRDRVARLLGPYQVGSTLGSFTVTAITGVRLGAASVTLQDRRGDSLQLDICRRDWSRAAMEPVASTAHYDLYVANGARGATTTGRRTGRIIDHLARTVAANEARSPRLDLLTLRQRLVRYPAGRFDARS